MPLPQSAPRQSVHTRTITCQGYQREDGLWDIEGRMTDVKPYHFPNQDRGGYINAGEALHDMSVRLTIDESFKVHAIVAVSDSTPFNYCPEITSAYQCLVGLSIKPGWNQKVKELLGGERGCTHLTDLLGPIATTAFQVLVAYQKRKELGNKQQATHPELLNTCHAFTPQSPVVAHFWPEYSKKLAGN